MIFNEVCGEKLSLLGFGAMRMPMLADGSGVDEAQAAEMIDCAIAGGLNYFDTAYPYHGGTSEGILGRILSSYPRESFYLADKYPGHQLAEKYDPAEIFEEQLRRCKVDYFDFYLLHNVYDKSIETYNDPRWGIMPYFIEQKRKGRIKHLGFSTHGSLKCMEEFLKRYGTELEFCQIQFNYLDWTLQNARAKCELLKKFNIPVWVMEPLRGGKLANIAPELKARLEAQRPGVGAHVWAFEWLHGQENVKMILSGMSTLAQVQDNLKIFEERKALSDAQTELLMELAEAMKDAVPCTSCRYCCEGCPQGLDIPTLIAHYNDFRVQPSFNVTMAIESLPEGKAPKDCIACGKCVRSCPQGIDVPGILQKFATGLAQQPSWAELCKQREEAQKKAK